MSHSSTESEIVSADAGLKSGAQPEEVAGAYVCFPSQLQHAGPYKSGSLKPIKSPSASCSCIDGKGWQGRDGRGRQGIREEREEFSLACIPGRGTYFSPGTGMVGWVGG